MNYNKEIYKVRFTEECKEEIEAIYKYISEKLINKEAAKRLMRKIIETINRLRTISRIIYKN